jgi:hypothetical protein
MGRRHAVCERVARPDCKTHTDTKSQIMDILEDMKKFLVSQNVTLGDVVMGEKQ